MKKAIIVLSIFIITSMCFAFSASGSDGYNDPTVTLPRESIPQHSQSDTSEDSSGGDWEASGIPIEDTVSVEECTVSKIKNITYTGKALKPSVTVKYNGKTLKKNKDYTLSYKDNTKIGKATVTIKGKGNYTGSVKKTFKIVPKGTTLTKVTAPKSKQLKVSWKKQSKQTTGYQLQYSTSSKFTKATVITVKGGKKTSALITKLAKGKKYFVRIRTYKTVGKTKYVSSWSKPLNCKTK
jgi:hypothetical protein